MPTELEIRDFRNLSNVRLPLESRMMIAGDNGSGKTSIADAIRFLYADPKLVMRATTKGNTTEEIRDGAKKGTVRLSNDHFEAAATFPLKGDPKITGTPPKATNVSLGITSQMFVLADVDKRSVILTDALKALPSKKDLAEALKGIISEKGVDNVWQVIVDNGWPGAEKYAEENLQNFRRDWTRLTNRSWGKDVKIEYFANAPKPEHTSELLSTLKAKVDEINKAQIVGESDRERWQQEANGLTAAQDAYKAAETARGAQREIANQLEEQLKALPDEKSEGNIQPCWTCSAPNLIANGKLCKPSEKADPAVLEKIAADRKKLQDDLMAARDLTARYNNEMTYQKVAIVSAQRAAGSLANDRTTSKEDADKAQADYLACKIGIEYATNYEAAKLAAASIERFLKIQEVLDPQGVRLTALTAGVDALNKKLAELCLTAGWKPVHISMAMEATRAGRPYRLLSTAQQFQVSTIIQLAISQLQDAQLIIIDNVDCMTKPNKIGLLRLIMAFKHDAVIIMMTHSDDPSKVPNLGKMKKGSTYWMTGEAEGTIERLPDA